MAKLLAQWLRPATGFPLAIQPAANVDAPGHLQLSLTTDTALGAEGYELRVSPTGVTITAQQPAGLFYGAQTFRQLLPPAIEQATPQSGPWRLEAGSIRDMPRFAWRGLMLDVARHFFGVAEIKRLIDLAAYYKLNRLHLHLSDDQGSRVEIKSWPRLAEHGGSTQVGGGPGGCYTQADYAAIVAYAQERHMIVVPEIDLPSHINAALASYAELNCDGVAPALYTGTEVGFSTLCAQKEITYKFLDDVVRELTALNPGPYFHIGGDEAYATSPADYRQIVTKALAIVRAHGKEVVGWEEIGQLELPHGTMVQQWNTEPARIEHTRQAVRQGAKVILSPANRTYLDMKYDASTPLGLTWAALIDVEDGYSWEPGTQVSGIGEEALSGVEAALWTETVTKREELDFMIFPRLPGVAEAAWSPAAGRSWAEYRHRLASQAPRWEAMGVDYYRSPLVPW